jgi:hypothetical protein
MPVTHYRETGARRDCCHATRLTLRLRFLTTPSPVTRQFMDALVLRTAILALVPAALGPFAHSAECLKEDSVLATKTTPASTSLAR